jgi:formate-dependent nitrite reductase cytochrome c552 subunit
MHDASQTEVLMGRDFFFMGDSLPILSKHANVKDACVGCHMVLNPQTHLSHGTPAVSTHNFYIKDADVPTLCANCHGNGTVDGEALQTFVENQLAVLGTKMSTGFKNKINAATGAGLYYYISTNKTTTQIASATTVTYSDGSFYVTGNLTSGQTGTTLKVTLTSFTTDNNGTAGAGYFPLIQPNDNLKKGSWNWTMIERDGSKGIHNPTLIQQVLTNSIAATY